MRYCVSYMVHWSYTYVEPLGPHPWRQQMNASHCQLCNKHKVSQFSVCSSSPKLMIMTMIMTTIMMMQMTLNSILLLKSVTFRI